MDCKDNIDKKGVSVVITTDRGKWKKNTCCAVPTQRGRAGRRRCKKKQL